MDEKEGNDLFNEPQGDNAPAAPAPPAAPNGPQAENMTPQADAPQAETPQPEGPEKQRSEADKEKRKKRILAVALAAILVVIVVLIILLLLRSCQPGHVYSGVWGSDDNQHWQICDDCGEPSEKEDHHFGDWTIIKQPTCTEEGEREHTCVECGKTVSETIPPEEHDWGDWVILLDPTCTEEGRVRHECNTCGAVEEEAVAPTGHYCDEDDWQRDEDEHWHICTVCGEEFDRGEHDWGSGVTQEGGDEAEFTCSECGGTKTEKVDPDEHTWGEWTVTKQPTCTETGAREHTCSDCGLTLEEILPANGHSYGAWSTTKQPTCGEEGARERTCAVCGYTQTGRLPATGEHTYNAWVVFKEATCAEEGERRRTCTECGQTWAEAIPKLSHVISPDWKSDEEDHWHECELCGTRLDEAAHTWDGGKTTVVPTPDNTGLKVYTCTECGATREEVLPVTEHLWSDWTVTKQPTCTQTGLREHTCLDCGKKETEIIPANGHTYTGWRSDADEHWRICSVCGVTFGREEHTWNSGTVTKAPTCTETGTRTYTCTKCEATKTETIAATGHSWGTWTTTKEATCTERGSQTHTCTVCGESETRSIDVLPHSWDEGTVTKQPTCTQTGVKTYTCTECKATKTESVAKIAHDYQEKFDASNHWEECSMCHAKRSTQAHSFAYETAAEQHTKYCTECGYKADPEAHTSNTWLTDASNQNHYKVCSACKATFAQGAHASDTWKTDGTSHWKVCDTCGKEFGRTAHEYGDTFYSDGAAGHHQECTVCGHKSDITDHDPDGIQSDASVHWINCPDCGYTSAKEPHGSQTWQTNDEEHWKICDTCGKEFDRGTHEYPDSGTYDDYESDEHAHWQECEVCGKESQHENHDVNDPGDTCPDCGVTVNYSAGLEFLVNADKTYFTVIGIGTVTDGAIIIPSTYADATSDFNTLPVSGIGQDCFDLTSKPATVPLDITSVTIPASVVRMEGNAFYRCDAMTEVKYEGTLSQWCSIAFSGEYANPAHTADELYIDGKLIDGALTITNSNVGNYAFNRYERLTSVTINGSASRVGNNAFSYCTNLTSVTLGSSIASIGSHAFDNCAITTITIPYSVTSIGDSAFNGCAQLQTVTFENPNNWAWGSTAIESELLSNPATAAKFLTDTFCPYNWTRS